MADGVTLISSFLTVSSAITILHEHTRITERTWEEVVKSAIETHKDCAKKNADEQYKILKVLTIPEKNGSIEEWRDEYLDAVTNLRRNATKYAIVLITLGAILILLSDIKFDDLCKVSYKHIAYSYCLIILIGMFVYWVILQWIISKHKKTINTSMRDVINKAQKQGKSKKQKDNNKNNPY